VTNNEEGSYAIGTLSVSHVGIVFRARQRFADFDLVPQFLKRLAYFDLVLRLIKRLAYFDLVSSIPKTGCMWVAESRAVLTSDPPHVCLR
jgi:hypothetical protein